MHSGALIDAHVHFYPTYDVKRFLDAASDSFARQPQTSARRVLCMAESAADNWFGTLALCSEQPSKQPPALAGSDWTRHPTNEPQSLRLTRDRDDAELLIIAGHQCVTAEDIEVLMLGHVEKYPDGDPAEVVVAAALAAGSLPLLPWGFGKWLGKRGELVAQLKEKFGAQLLLGDNSGRLAGTPTPALLRSGQEQGHCLLPGSDPLPMQGEEQKVAGFGAWLPGDMSAEAPFADLKTLLANGNQPEPFGAGETLIRFVRNQLLMQVRKRRTSNV